VSSLQKFDHVEPFPMIGRLMFQAAEPEKDSEQDDELRAADDRCQLRHG
jgi:hypothetical protein